MRYISGHDIRPSVSIQNRTCCSERNQSLDDSLNDACMAVIQNKMLRKSLSHAITTNIYMNAKDVLTIRFKN